MLVQIKNAQDRGHAEVLIPFSKMRLAIAEILKNRNFISGVEKKKKKKKKAELDYMAIGLKYENSRGVISGIKLVSKPSKKIYIRNSEIRPVKSGYGVMVVSTSKGLMAGDDARKSRLGGEILFEIW